MKISITGATGFVGLNLASFLSSHLHHIEAVSLRSDTWRETIPTNTEVLIHLAGKAHDTSNTSETESYFKINRDLTIDLFDWFLQSEARDFFFFSSIKAVADTANGVLTEEVLANPITPYGRSKYEAEQYLLSHDIPDTKRVFIIRPCMIHGPGNKGNLNMLYQIVDKGIPWPLGAYENKRSFMSVDNLCYLIEAMIQNNKVDSGIYNFADDVALSTNELVSLIAETSGRSSRIWTLSKRLIQSIASIGDKVKLPLNSERLKKLTENYIVSNSKVKDALGIEKLPLTAQEGIRKTIKAFKR